MLRSPPVVIDSFESNRQDEGAVGLRRESEANDIKTLLGVDVGEKKRRYRGDHGAINVKIYCAAVQSYNGRPAWIGFCIQEAAGGRCEGVEY